MRKIVLSLIGSLLVIALAACGAEPKVEEEAGLQTIEEEEESKEANVEVVNEAFGSWKGVSGSVWVNYATELKNVGDKPIEIETHTAVFLDDEGNTLLSAPLTSAGYNIIQPNETAYFVESLPVEGITDRAEIKDTKIELEAMETDLERMTLETEDINFELGSSGEIAYYEVRGTVRNPHPENAEDILMTAGLYNDNDELLGVLKGGFSMSVNAGESEEFKLIYPELPGEIAGKVTKVTVKAYGDVK